MTAMREAEESASDLPSELLSKIKEVKPKPLQYRNIAAHPTKMNMYSS